MTKLPARIFVYVLVLGSAIMIPVSAKLGFFFTPTFYAGSTVIGVFLAANPRLLGSSQAEARALFREGVQVPVALIVGALLMAAGVMEALL